MKEGKNRKKLGKILVLVWLTNTSLYYTVTDLQLLCPQSSCIYAIIIYIQ